MDITNEVQKYYGETLQASNDLKTDACCTIVDYPQEIKTALSDIHDEVMSKYYGCGLTIPQELKGLRVLDLGSGSGRDCYLLSKMVGEEGSVVGVDMTDQQLEVANKHLDYHQKKFGYTKSNVEFKKGNIEKLDELDLRDYEFDLIISNCVINLAKDKESVLKQAHRLLQDGGEMYFSDVYASRRVPEDLQRDPVLYGECLSGALYWNDFENLAKKVGFSDPRVVESRKLAINNQEIKQKVGEISFYSVTYRLFKINQLEPQCEEYGQAVIYNGKLKHAQEKFILDDHHIFETGKIERVCGNSFRMLKQTRFQQYFQFIGDFQTHYGIFKGCGTNIPYTQTATSSQQEGACC